jgi:hypothetical protein
MAFEGLDFGILTRGVPQIDVAGSLAKGYQLRDMAQARKDDDTMREISQQAGDDLGQLAELAQQRGLYKQALGFRKQKIDFDADVAKTKEALARADKLTREAVQAGNDEAAAFATWAFHENKAGRLTPEAWVSGLQEVSKAHPVMAGALQQFPQFSESAIRKMLYKASTTKTALSTFMPKVEERSGALVPVTTDILGQQTVGAPVGVKAQDPLGQLEQDLRNGLITEEDAFARRKMLREGKPAVQVNMQERAPSGYRWGGGGSLEPIPGGPANKEIPSGVTTSFVDNEKLLATIDDAIKGVKANPEAIGLKNLIPDVINQRMDPEGSPVRALIAQVGSLRYKDMSGAAVTVSEDARMAPYIPKLTDAPGVVVTKLQGLAKEIERTQKGMAVAFKDGHRTPPQFDKYLKPSTASPASFAEIREAVKPGGKYAGKTVDEVVFALRQRGIEVK